MTIANWTLKDPRIVSQPIDVTDTVKNHALGTIVRASHPTYGEGEFIYLLGVASTVAGSLVTFDTYIPNTVLAPSTAGLGKPLAVAMSANVASQYGWYQIGGSAVVATNGTLSGAGVAVYLAGSGQVTSTQANGKQVLGAISSTATGTPASGFAVVQIERPSAQGQVV